MSDSDSDLEVVIPVKPPSKRRRIIDPSSIVTVPIYSNKVDRCLQLKPERPLLVENNEAADRKANLWTSTSEKRPELINLMESDEEQPDETVKSKEEQGKLRGYISSPSPPPPSESPEMKVSRRVNRKIKEVNRKLMAVDSLLSPVTTERRLRRNESCPSVSPEKNDDSDDVIVLTSPSSGGHRVREIPLKFRCRMDVYKIPVLSSAPLREAVDGLSKKLQVPSSRILLLRKDMELPTHVTVDELGLGIADIIDCVVTADEKEKADGSDVITVRLQGKDKGSAQEYSLHREESLGSVLSQYLSSMATNTWHKVQFRYDGLKIKQNDTPSQLDMEDGDIIEVWT